MRQYPFAGGIPRGERPASIERNHALAQCLIGAFGYNPARIAQCSGAHPFPQLA
jgi:hypothetical protein